MVVLTYYISKKWFLLFILFSLARISNNFCFCLGVDVIPAGSYITPANIAFIKSAKISFNSFPFTIGLLASSLPNLVPSLEINDILLDPFNIIESVLADNTILFADPINWEVSNSDIEVCLFNSKLIPASETCCVEVKYKEAWSVSNDSTTNSLFFFVYLAICQYNNWIWI